MMTRDQLVSTFAAALDAVRPKEPTPENIEAAIARYEAALEIDAALADGGSDG